MAIAGDCTGAFSIRHFGLRQYTDFCLINIVGHVISSSGCLKRLKNSMIISSSECTRFNTLKGLVHLSIEIHGCRNPE